MGTPLSHISSKLIGEDQGLLERFPLWLDIPH